MPSGIAGHLSVLAVFRLRSRWSFRAGPATFACVLLITRFGGLVAQSLPPLEEHTVRVFGMADGLLTSHVLGITQSADGYLFAGASPGLARYDGTVFEPVPLPGMRNVDWFEMDSRDRLWLHSVTGQIGILEGGRFRILPPVPGYPGQTTVWNRLAGIVSVSETSDGSVWLGGGRGLVRVELDDSVTYTRYTVAHGLPTDSVISVIDTSDGRRIVVTLHGLASVTEDPTAPGGLRFNAFGPACRISPAPIVGVSRIRVPCMEGPGQYVEFDHADGKFVRVDSTSMPWLESGPRQIDRGSFHEGWQLIHGVDPKALGLELPSGTLIGRVLVARNGARWVDVTVQGGVDRHYLVRVNAGRTERIPLREHLDFEQIENLFEDREGSIWVATDRGLLQLTARRILAVGARHGLAHTMTIPVLETSDGAVWVGTWGGGLHRFAEGRLTHRYGPGNGLPSDRIRALYEGADGTLWIGTRTGTATFREDRLTTTTISASETRAFAETPDGRFWVGTDYGLLVGRTSDLTEASVDTAMIASVWSLHVDRAGSLWIGSNRGLHRYADGRLDALPGGVPEGAWVVSVHEDPDGSLWFGTVRHGLYRYRGGRFASITTREGLHADGIWCMIEDDDDAVWLSSDRGILRINRNELNDLADARERGETPPPLAGVLYTEAAGSPSSESNRASPGCMRHGDRLIFNNLRGLVVIDPSGHGAVPPPNTVVRAVTADGRALPVDGGDVSMSAATRQLSFTFAALSFTSPEQNRYRYRLDGYDDDWVQAGHRRNATYTGLPPGRFTLRVQGASGAGAWGATAVYPFTVTPLVWQALWFRTLAVALLGTLLAVAYRYRVRKLLEMERMRVRIASDLHDDIGANLSSIALLSQMLEGRIQLGERERRQLGRIGAAANETMGGLRDVIWLVDPAHDNLDALLQRMRTAATGLLDGTQWTMHVPESLPDRRLSMAFVRNTFMIYKEALNNAVRHGRPSHVDIVVDAVNGKLILRVDDDGTGFDLEAAPGNGLGNMKRRAAEIGGQLEIASEPGRGTSVSFTASFS